jgi:transcriptional regulator with XRE-family HTH domain
MPGMARKTPVPERERAICARLREARLETRLSQVAFAKEAGIDSSLLASYEHARVPIRYEFGAKVCNLLELSQRWLATGIDEDTRGLYLPIHHSLNLQIRPRMLFSEAYDLYLKPLYEEQVSEGAAVIKAAKLRRVKLSLRTVGAPTPERVSMALQGRIRSEVSQFPPHLLDPLKDHILRALDDFAASHVAEIKSHLDAVIRSEQREAAEDSERKLLTNTSVSVSVASMKSPMDKLIARLRAATRARGAKAELARALNIPAETIIRYLSGKMEPGGDTTLRLLQWVEQEERK